MLPLNPEGQSQAHITWLYVPPFWHVPEQEAAVGKGNTSKFGWLVVLTIYVALAKLQPYRDLEAGDNQSLKS